MSKNWCVFLFFVCSILVPAFQCCFLFASMSCLAALIDVAEEDEGAAEDEEDEGTSFSPMSKAASSCAFSDITAVVSNSRVATRNDGTQRERLCFVD